MGSWTVRSSGGVAQADRADVKTVADQTARYALVAGTGEDEISPGDIVVQTDTNPDTLWMYIGGTVSSASSWQQQSSLPASIIASGQLALARGGTGADLSATGGTGQVLKQASAGGVITVGTVDLDFLSDVAITTPASGHVIQHNGTSFVNRTLAAAGILATPSMTSDYVPKWNGAALVDSALQFASSNAILAGALAWDTGYNRFVGPNGTADDLYMVANGLLVFNAGGTSQRANISSTGLAVGLGTTAASAMLHARSTTDQMWLEYSSGVYAKFNVGSGGRTKAYSSNVDDSWWIGYSDSACIQLSFSSFLPSISTPNGYLRLFGGASGTYLSLGTNNSNELRLSEGNKMGFFATAPAARVTGFGVTNASTRKTFDTTSVTLPQLAEVVGTLIAALGSTAIDGITGVGLIGTT